MKKTIVLSLVVLISFATLHSCKKASTDTVTTQTINATVAMNQSVLVTLGTTSAKQSVSISSQAAHATTSSVQKNVSAGTVLYAYTPATSYFGTDQVTIKAVSDTTHSCQAGSKVTTLYTVNLTVTK